MENQDTIKLKPFTYEWWMEMREISFWKSKHLAWSSRYLKISEYCKYRAKNCKKSDDKWIPVTERLPEEAGAVLVYVRNGYVTTMSYHCPFGGNARVFQWWGFGKWIDQHSRVTHWMMLPEPPKN